MSRIHIASFYRFKEINNIDGLRNELLELCKKLNLLGTILISKEGFNGSIAGKKKSILIIFDYLQRELNLDANISDKARWNNTKIAPFKKLHVKIKSEIVALGREDIQPFDVAGKSIKPIQWNKLIQDPETIVIDTRNEYEVNIGSFPNAINPKTDSFREFPEFVKNIPETEKSKPVAMFCTGGIRCEKAAALMIEFGFEDVNQLEGGILNYIEKIDDADNLWQGECFVFDDRVTVDNELKDGKYIQCHACRNPLSIEETESEDYCEGISCPKCINKIPVNRINRFKERQKQINLAKQRGEKHIGKVMSEA